MRGIVAILAIALVAGCEKSPKPKVSNADLQEFAKAHPGITNECLNNYRSSGDWVPIVTGAADCFEMQAPRRWNGIWNKGWEWSNFCAAPATTCSASFVDDEMDLRFSEKAYPNGAELDGMFEIEFVGRRTKVAGYHGHLNQYPHFIVADRVTAIRRIAEPPERAKD